MIDLVVIDMRGGAFLLVSSMGFNDCDRGKK